MKIQIGQYFIRNFRKSDIPSLVKYANNRSIWLNLRDRFPHPYTREEAVKWLNLVSKQEPEASFAIASSEELIGGVGLQLKSDVHRYTAEIGYWLGEPFWGNGIATEAVKAVTEYGFSELKLIRIYAGVYKGNDASVRVLEKAGYKYEGCLSKNVIKDGKILGQLIYARIN